MKRYLLLIVLAVTFTCEGVYAQAKPLTAWNGRVKTTKSAWFDTTVITTASFQFVDLTIYNNGTDTIYAAKDVDTTFPAYIAIPPGYFQTVWTQMKNLRVKGRTAGQSYTYVIGLGQNAAQQRLGTPSAPIYVTTQADSGTWGIWDSVRFTRPSNVTAYSDSDVVRTGTATGGSFLGLTLARRNGAFGYITQVALATDTANVTNAIFDVLFFSDTTGMGATLPADNAGYRSNFENSKYYLGTATVALTTYGSNATGATGSWGTASNLLIPYQCAAASKKIYALIVVRAAYSPKYNGIFRLTTDAQPTN